MAIFSTITLLVSSTGLAGAAAINATGAQASRQKRSDFMMMLLN
jgi:hypothetical protein